MLDTLMVAHSVLAEINQNLAALPCPPMPPDFPETQAQLQRMAGLMDQWLSKARAALADPAWRTVTQSEPFEDIIALLAQIEWRLQGCYALKGTIFGAGAFSPTALAELAEIMYEAIAAAAILESIGSFPKALTWAATMAGLDPAIQIKLRVIDKRIMAVFLPATVLSDIAKREAILLAVFFDCYFGFQQKLKPSGSAYDGLFREVWPRRFRKNRDYKPTSKRILLGYSSSLDYPIMMNTTWFANAMNVVATAEGKSLGNLSGELDAFVQAVDAAIQNNLSLPLPPDIRTASDVLKTLLGYVRATAAGKTPLSKVRVNIPCDAARWNLMDMFAQLAIAAGVKPDTGGAAAAGADNLLKLGEPNVDLLMPFVPPRLLDILEPDINILWYDRPAGATKLTRCTPAALKGRTGPPHPEVHNYVIEFAPGAPVVYNALSENSVTPVRTDRVIVINKFGYYLASRSVDSYVDRTLASTDGSRLLRVNGLFGFDSSINPALSPADCAALAEQAAHPQEHLPPYDLFVIAGLQSFDAAAQATAEKELKLFSDAGIKIHIEISGEKDLDWLVKVIAGNKLYSVSCGEELDQLYQATCRYSLGLLTDAARQTESARQQVFDSSLLGQPHGYQMAEKAAVVLTTLGLTRLYVHDTDMDIIVRDGTLSLEKRMVEIRAGIVAKWVVLRMLMSRGINLNQDRDTMTQVKETGLWALLDTARAFYARAAVRRPDGSIELYGVNVKNGLTNKDCAIMFVPVRWVYGAMQDRLRIVGAGDTTSIISCVQAMFMSATVQRRINQS